jgi:hypothetical protein
MAGRFVKPGKLMLSLAAPIIVVAAAAIGQLSRTAASCAERIYGSTEIQLSNVNGAPLISPRFPPERRTPIRPDGDCCRFEPIW